MHNANYFMPPKMPTGRPMAIPKNSFAAFPIPFLSGFAALLFADSSIVFVSGLLTGFSAAFSAIVGADGGAALLSPKFYARLVKFRRLRVHNPSLPFEYLSFFSVLKKPFYLTLS